MGMRPSDFRRTYKIRFGDTDPAGVMYFPRFLDIFHEVFEDWFDDDLRMPYRWVLEDTRIGFPAVHTECDYRKPFKFGQTMEVELSVIRVGSKSFECRYRGRLAGETEVRVDATVVTAVVNLDNFSGVPIPAPLRKALLDRLVTPRPRVPVGHISAAGE
jgi:4-hydroxybenzoyl-CoA thioesterase